MISLTQSHCNVTRYCDWLTIPNKLISAFKVLYHGFFKFTQVVRKKQHNPILPIFHVRMLQAYGKFPMFHSFNGPPWSTSQDASWRPKLRVTPSRLELPWSWPSPALEGTELQLVVAAKRRRLAWELQRLETVMPGRRGPGVGDSGDLNGKWWFLFNGFLFMIFGEG